MNLSDLDQTPMPRGLGDPVKKPMATNSQSMTLQDLLKMELHETACTGEGGMVSILRVPNGWIYTYFDSVDGVFVPETLNVGTFVPYSSSHAEIKPYPSVTTKTN